MEVEVEECAPLNLNLQPQPAVVGIPGFFIVTAIYMISEKASDVILSDAADLEAGVDHGRRVVLRAHLQGIDGEQRHAEDEADQVRPAEVIDQRRQCQQDRYR